MTIPAPIAHSAIVVGLAVMITTVVVGAIVVASLVIHSKIVPTTISKVRARFKSKPRCGECGDTGFTLLIHVDPEADAKVRIIAEPCGCLMGQLESNRKSQAERNQEIESYAMRFICRQQEWDTKKLDDHHFCFFVEDEYWKDMMELLAVLDVPHFVDVDKKGRRYFGFETAFGIVAAQSLKKRIEKEQKR